MAYSLNFCIRWKYPLLNGFDHSLQGRVQSSLETFVALTESGDDKDDDPSRLGSTAGKWKKLIAIIEPRPKIVTALHQNCRREGEVARFQSRVPNTHSSKGSAKCEYCGDQLPKYVSM